MEEEFVATVIGKFYWKMQRRSCSWLGEAVGEEGMMRWESTGRRREGLHGFVLAAQPSQWIIFVQEILSG